MEFDSLLCLRPRLLALLGLIWLSASLSAWAQSTPSSATPAAYEQPSAPRPAGFQITFRSRAAKIGDQVGQRLVVDMQLDSTVRQAQQVVRESRSRLSQRLERTVTAAAVREELMVAARVRYARAEKQTLMDGRPSQSQSDPVAGKAYRCARQGERLLITDEQGQIPPLAQYEVVARGMQGLGRPNPLAVFLADKTVALGEKLSLSTELAGELLGLGEAIDQVEMFELTLNGTKTVDGRPCAVFHALLEATQHQKGQMRLQLEGPMTVEVDGCRLIAAELQGPVGLAQSVAAAGASYHMTGSGRLGVSIHATYADAN